LTLSTQPHQLMPVDFIISLPLPSFLICSFGKIKAHNLAHSWIGNWFGPQSIVPESRLRGPLSSPTCILLLYISSPATFSFVFPPLLPHQGGCPLSLSSEEEESGFLSRAFSGGPLEEGKDKGWSISHRVGVRRALRKPHPRTSSPLLGMS
jgi:hypothetical protein